MNVGKRTVRSLFALVEAQPVDLAARESSLRDEKVEWAAGLGELAVRDKEVAGLGELAVRDEKVELAAPESSLRDEKVEFPELLHDSGKYLLLLSTILPF